MIEIPEEMKQRYFEKSGDDYICDGEKIQNEYGFMIYRLMKDAFCVLQCFGDGKYWDETARKMAREKGCTKVRFGTKRKPDGFERKFGYKVVGYVLEAEV